MKKIKLDSVDLSSLKNVAGKITIRLDNSSDIIEQMGGPDYFYLLLDVKDNSAVPLNADRKMSLLEQYTGANYAGIYGPYIESESFDGIYNISCGDENIEWSLDFHGSFLEWQEGDLEVEKRDLIIAVLNPGSIYLIANEVLSNCR